MLFLPGLLLAQQPKAARPYDPKLLKQEPEMGMGAASFKVSPRLRDMKEINGVVLWVSADKQSLSAYEGSRLLWKTNVVAACLHGSGPGETNFIVSESSEAFIFFFVGESNRIIGEIDRKTGRVTSSGIDPM